MKATITSNGRVTIPLAIREQFNLSPGDKIEFSITNGYVVLTVLTTGQKDNKKHEE